MRRAYATLVVLLSFSVPALATEAPKSQKRPLLERVTPYWQELWQFLKNGSGIDPFGVPAPGEEADPQTSQEGDNGSGIDPWGRT